MPTTVVKTIRASGGDYTSLSAWEAANQGNLVAADEIRVAECYNDWPSGLADTVEVSGSTTDATRYMMITVAPGHRHNGTPRSGFYAKSSANWQTGFAATDAYCVFEWLDFSATHTGASSFKGPATSARVFTLRRCIGTNGAGHADAASYQQLGNGTTVIACLAVGGVYGFVSTNWASGYFYNCVAANCQKGYGWIGGSGAPIYKNCVAYNCSTYAYNGGSASSASNASSASSGAPGSAPVYNITSSAFADAANNDFHLAPGSALIGAGANLYADFQADIDGDAWPSSGAWDIGFDHYVASGPAVHDLVGTASASAAANAGLTVQTTHDLAGDAAAQAGAAGALIINGVFAEDDFAGSGPTSLTNPPWTKTAAIGLGNLSIQAGMLRGLTAGNSALYVHNNAAPSPDYTVSLDIQAGAVDLGGSIVGVAGRFNGQDFYSAKIGSSVCALQKFILLDGGFNSLDSANIPQVINPGDSVTLGLRMVGDQIALLVDGVAVIEVTDSTIAVAGQAGVQTYTAATTDWYGDNFRAALISAGTGTVDLAAAAAAQPAASAGLTLAVPIAGAGIALATTGGALAIGIPLAGAAAGQSDAPGVLTVTGNTDLAGNAVVQPAAGGGLHLTVPLSASAVTAALAAAGLTQSVPLAGDAAGSAQAPGELSVGVGLAGGDAAQAGASGTLTLNVSLAGNPIATAAAAAGLTVAGSSYLAGAAVANPAASGVLTHGVPLAGAALTVSGAQGSLTRIVPLASASASASIATGGLDLRVELAVDALVQALAGASLDVQGNAGLAGDAAAQAGALATLALRINLAADAVARAVAAGALAGDGTLAGVPGLIVSRRPRSWRARGEARAWRVAPAARTWRAA